MIAKTASFRDYVTSRVGHAEPCHGKVDVIRHQALVSEQPVCVDAPEQENSDVLGGCGKERGMIRSELLRRLRAGIGLARPLSQSQQAVPAAA